MKKYLIIPTILLLLSSCVPNKKLVYFRNQSFSTSQPTLMENNTSPYRLQSGDVINIRIKTLDAESSSYFNILPEQGVLNYNTQGLYINSYSIDQEEMIELPGAGRVKVGGLTLDEAQKKVRESLQEFLNNASVILKLVSFKITVLGEVSNPGYYFIYNDQATILEGLGLAGDLTDFGNRQNITLIRQTTKGPEAILLDLKDAAVLQSAYYYLKPNDVIYVQPLKAKTARGNLNSISFLGVLFSAVTAAVLVLDYVNPR